MNCYRQWLNGAARGYDILTLGQYLQPTLRHLPRSGVYPAGNVRPL